MNARGLSDDASGSQEVIDVIKGRWDWLLLLHSRVKNSLCRQGSHVILTIGRDEPQNECECLFGLCL